MASPAETTPKDGAAATPPAADAAPPAASSPAGGNDAGASAATPPSAAPAGGNDASGKDVPASQPASPAAGGNDASGKDAPSSQPASPAAGGNEASGKDAPASQPASPTGGGGGTDGAGAAAAPPPAAPAAPKPAEPAVGGGDAGAKASPPAASAADADGDRRGSGGTLLPPVSPPASPNNNNRTLTPSELDRGGTAGGSSMMGSTGRMNRSASAPLQNKAKLRVEQLLKTGLPLAEWTAKDVGDWTEVLKLGQYRKQFICFGVNGVALTRMDHATLKELGVRNLGHQHMIMDGMAELRDQCFQATGEASLPGSPPMSKTGKIARSLAKKQHEIVEHTGVMRAMQTKLNEIIRNGVLEQLEHMASVLKMEESQGLLKDTQNILKHVKKQVLEVEKGLEEEKKTLATHARQAGVVLSGTADEGLYKSLTNTVVMPHISTKRITDDDWDQMLQRLYPNPSPKRKPREVQTWVPKPAAPPYVYKPAAARKLPEDEILEVFAKFHPDPAEQKGKRQAMDDAFMAEVKRHAARGTGDLASEERKERIDNFNDRYKADLVRRGIA